MIPASIRLFTHDAFRVMLCVALSTSTVQVAAESTSPAALAQSAGTIYPHAKSPEGTEVYLEGKMEAGRPMVYSFVPAQGDQPSRVRVGTIESEGHIQWKGTEATPTSGAKPTPATSHVPSTAAHAPTPLVKTPGNTAMAGKPVPHVMSPEGFEVYYDGTLFGGRQVVYYYVAETAAYHFGVLQDGGKVQWYTSDGLPLADGVIAEYKPSRLPKLLGGWGAEKSETLRRNIRSMLRGETRPVEYVEKDASSRFHDYITESQKLPGTAIGQVGGGMVAFYIGMGAIAAFTLMREYPSNPMVLEKYLSKMTDPMGYLMLGGFMLVALPFINKVNGVGTAGQLVRAVPYFAAGLVAGAVAQGFITYSLDADVRQCAGVGDLTFTRDMAACDRVYDKLSGEKLVTTWVPPIASLLAGGGIYLGVSYLTNITGLAAFLRSFSIMKSPRAGPIGMVATGVAFLGAYEIADRVFQVEKHSRDYLIADHTITNNLYGATIREAEENLYKGYSQLKAGNWMDNSGDDAKKTCPMNEGNDGFMEVSCGYPLDMAGILNRYSTLLEGWRNNHMAPTMAAYNQWVKKVENYHKVLNASYKAYDEFVSRIQFDLSNPGSDPADSRGFNPTTIRNLEKDRTNGLVYKAVPQSEGSVDFIGFDRDYVVSGGDEIMHQDFSGTWRYVNTAKFYDYILASMACGPEAESRGAERGILQGIRDLGATLITRNTSPKEVIADTSGFSIVFTPPKLVQPLDNQFSNVCENPTGRGIPNVALLDPIQAQTPDKFSVSWGPFSSKKTYKNLYQYIEDNIRPSVLDPSQNRFDLWWAQSIMGQVTRTEKLLRTDYVKMLLSTYKPALTVDSYHWCEKSDTLKDASLARYLRELNFQPGPCAADWNHRLANGIFNSVRDEARLYLAMLLDVHMSTSQNLAPEDRARSEKKVLEAAKTVTMLLDLLYMKVSVVNPQARQDIGKVSEAAGNSFMYLSKLVLPPKSHWTRPHGASPATQWKALLLEKIQGLIARSSDYYNILHTFEVDDQPTSPDASTDDQIPDVLLSPRKATGLSTNSNSDAVTVVPNAPNADVPALPTGERSTAPDDGRI